MTALPRPMSRLEYDALVASGALADDRVELLEGEIVQMASQGPNHADTTASVAGYLQIALYVAYGSRYKVRQHSPYAASDISEPEPDIAVVDHADYRRDHPAAAHLLVEVSRSSRRRDLDRKTRIYAQAGVPLYWVVDLVRDQVVVHAVPRPAQARYAEVTVHPLDTDLPVLGLTVNVTRVIG